MPTTGWPPSRTEVNKPTEGPTPQGLGDEQAGCDGCTPPASPPAPSKETDMTDTPRPPVLPATKVILVVEDNEVARQGLAAVLRREGYRVTSPATASRPWIASTPGRRRT